MASKQKSEALALKKKRSKQEKVEEVIVIPDSPSKKKKQSRSKELPESDFVTEPHKKNKKHVDAEVVAEHPQVTSPKKKKKSKDKEEVVFLQSTTPKSPMQLSKVTEVVSPTVSHTPSKKRSRAEEIEVAESPKKKHKKIEETADKGVTGGDIILHPKQSQQDGAGTDKKKTNNKFKFKPGVMFCEFDCPVIELWPKEDMNSLFTRMRSVIPKEDKFSFHTRQEKVNWNLVAFGEYSGEDCKNMWLQVVRHLRGFRLLNELIDDAMVWVDTPWSKFGKKKSKSQDHPDKPHRPMSAYMTFYMANKPRIAAAHPGMSAVFYSQILSKEYRELSSEEKKKYEEIAEQGRKEYKENLKIFEMNHPEAFPSSVSGPKKSRTPIQIFSEDRAKKLENTDLSPQQIKEAIREKWKGLSDKKRLKWIKKAADEHAVFREELKAYMAAHPDFKPDPKKTSVLNRKELELLLKDAGRPEKPPANGLRMFVRDEFQSEITNGNRPEEAMKILTARWKALSADEKQVYTDKLAKEHERYQKDYERYLNSLSVENREYEELVTQTITKKKIVETKEAATETPDKALFPGEPQKPPSSAYNLFVQSFLKKSGLKETEAKTFWDHLPESDKKRFETKQKDMMEKYMAKFERFLKSLSKAELAAYKKLHEADRSPMGNKASKTKSKGGNRMEKPDSSGSSDSETDSHSEDESDSDAEKAEESESEQESDSSDEPEVVHKSIIINKPAASSSDSDSSDSD